MPTAPAGSLLEIRFAADQRHDADASDHNGYRWVKVDPPTSQSLEGLVAKVDNDKAQMVLVKLDPQDITERDLLVVKKVPDERGRPAISFQLTPDGAKRFGAITRAHLPVNKGEFVHRYRLALIVQGTVVALPMVNSEVRDAGIIEFGDLGAAPKEFDRVVQLLAGAAACAPPPTAKAVSDQADAIREAKAVDLPALADANRISIESAASGSQLNLANLKSVDPFVQALQPRQVPPGGGELAATLSFFRDQKLIRKIWVYDDIAQVTLALNGPYEFNIRLIRNCGVSSNLGC